MSEHAQSDYAVEQRAKLDAKVTELRAEGWDVVARRERDLALSKRDDALDEVERLRGVLAIVVAAPEHAREYAEAALAWRRTGSS